MFWRSSSTKISGNQGRPLIGGDQQSVMTAAKERRYHESAKEERREEASALSASQPAGSEVWWEDLVCGVGTAARLGDNGWVSGKKRSNGPPSTRCSGGEAVNRPHFCIVVTTIIFQGQRKDLQGNLWVWVPLPLAGRANLTPWASGQSTWDLAAWTFREFKHLSAKPETQIQSWELGTLGGFVMLPGGFWALQRMNRFCQDINTAFSLVIDMLAIPHQHMMALLLCWIVFRETSF